MKYTILFSFLLCTIFSVAQESPCWKILRNNIIIAKSSFNTVANCSLSPKKKGIIKIVFACDKKPSEYNRSYIFMDSTRKELYRIPNCKHTNYATITINKLKEISHTAPFSIYTVGIPKDPKIAATVRVMPVLLSTVNWQ